MFPRWFLISAAVSLVLLVGGLSASMIAYAFAFSAAYPWTITASAIGLAGWAGAVGTMALRFLRGA